MYHSNNKVTKTNSTERNNNDNNNNNKTTEGKRKQLKNSRKIVNRLHYNQMLHKTHRLPTNSILQARQQVRQLK